MVLVLLLSNLLYIISPVISWTHSEINEAFNPTPKLISDFTNNEKYYTDKGNLFIVGNGTKGEYSNIINLSFKKSALEKIPHFMIMFCLEPKSSCTSGITICYNSQLNEVFIKPQFHIKARDDLVCENKQHSAFKVYTDSDREFFFIKASIDKHIYKFPIPPNLSEKKRKCFVINMGSEKSIETSITNIKGEKLVFIGNQPVNFAVDKPLYSEARKDLMNLWMLFLDMVPITPVMDYNVLPLQFAYGKPLQFAYGNNDCGLTAEFSSVKDETLNRCYKDLEDIGGCVAQKLKGASTHCEVELRISQGFEVENEMRKALKEGKQKEDTTTEEVGVGFEAYSEIGLSEMIKVGGKILISYKKSWSNTHMSNREIELSESSTKREMAEAQQAIKMTVHRTDGRSVHFYQLYLSCGGLTYRTKTIIAVGEYEGIYDKHKQTDVLEAKEGEIVLPLVRKNEAKNDETFSGIEDEDLQQND